MVAAKIWAKKTFYPLHTATHTRHNTGTAQVSMLPTRWRRDNDPFGSDPNLQ